jgi:precorrin-3B methylase
MAPVAFIAVNISVRHGTNGSVTLEARNDNSELVLPNIAALTWLSRLSGVALKEIDEDSAGKHPWDELAQTTAEVCRMVNIPVPEVFATGMAMSEGLELEPAPRADEDGEQAKIVPAAVLGLYPMANQGLIRDTQALIDGEAYSGPIESFLKVDVSLEPSAAEGEQAEGQSNLHLARKIEQERLVAAADPCQARAVMLAKSARGLVVHGPPGTGKSQTIANIIGDHLARGERVLFVCDKRTALDVVMNRLQAMRLGDLCAVVHDPRRDQRELYRGIREQLENLSTSYTDPSADAELSRVDRELLSLHGRLTEVHSALMRRPSPAEQSFHQLVGRWLSFGSTPIQVPRKLLGNVALEQVEMNAALVSAMLQRAAKCGYLKNPWRAAAGTRWAPNRP